MKTGGGSYGTAISKSPVRLANPRCSGDLRRKRQNGLAITDPRSGTVEELANAFENLLRLGHAPRADLAATEPTCAWFDEVYAVFP